jgi:hypothetical protein
MLWFGFKDFEDEICRLGNRNTDCPFTYKVVWRGRMHSGAKWVRATKSNQQERREGLLLERYGIKDRRSFNVASCCIKRTVHSGTTERK